MSYYRVCPRCGAHLDPGEICDCQGAELRERQEQIAERIAALTDAQFKYLVELARVEFGERVSA